jgi:hypothetical protein
MDASDGAQYAARLESCVQEVMAIADASFDARDLTPALERTVALVQANPNYADTATSVFLSLLDERRGGLILSTPGAVEVLEYAMHRLRWRTVHVEVAKLARSARDPRVSSAAERVLEAFADGWETGEIYERDVRRR